MAIIWSWTPLSLSLTDQSARISRVAVFQGENSALLQEKLENKSVVLFQIGDFLVSGALWIFLSKTGINKTCRMCRSALATFSGGDVLPSSSESV